MTYKNQKTTVSAERRSLAGNVRRAVAKFLADNQTHSSSASLESFDQVPTRNVNGNFGVFDQDAQLSQLLEEAVGTENYKNMTDEQKQGIFDRTRSIMSAKGLGGNINSFLQSEARPVATEGVESISYSRLVGSAMGMISREARDSAAALEAFGADMDKMGLDERTAIMLTVLAGQNDLMARVLPTQTTDSNIVTHVVRAPEIYDLGKAANQSAAVRNTRSQGHRIPYIDLVRRPSTVNTKTDELKVRAANDSNTNPVIYDAAKNALRVNTTANLMDLARDPSRLGWGVTDFTDLISEGGRVTSLFVEVKTGGETPVTEVFELSVKTFNGARYTHYSNNTDASDRQAMMTGLTLALKPLQKTVQGANSTILGAAFNGTKIVLNIMFNAVLTLKTGQLTSQGQVSATLAPTEVGGTVTSGQNTAFAGLTIRLVGFSNEIRASEENLRKTALAARINDRNQQFEIPVGRFVSVDFSLQQQSDDETVALMDKILNLGSSDRGLEIIESMLNDVLERLDFERENPELTDGPSSLAASFAAGTLVRPTVFVEPLNFDDANDPIEVLRESERPAEVSSRARARIMALLARLHQVSLYHNQLNGGETPVYKVITSPFLAEILFAQTQYHNVFNEARKFQENVNNATYSTFLDNGIRLDIVVTDMEKMNSRMFIIPIREGDPKAATSFATMYDRGTFTANYIPASAMEGGARRRLVATTRKIPYVTNPSGLIINVSGLQEHYGLAGNESTGAQIGSIAA